MGGHAFDQVLPQSGQQAVRIIRLSPALYTSLKAELTITLREHYAQVISPREAPGKVDHGDIDFLVQDSIVPHGPSPSALASALHAAAHRTTGPTTNFAVPVITPPASSGRGSDDEDKQTSHAQVDVHVVPGDTLAWLAHMHSDGDKWQILGAVLRPYGLTATDTGFHARIPDASSSSAADDDGQSAVSVGRRASRVLLSTDPQRVLAFLGLSWAEHEAGFATPAALYGWIATCRLFSPAVFNAASVRAAEKANSKGRRRMRERPLFAGFVGSYAPSLSSPDDDDGDTTMPSREEVTRQALAFFGKQDEFDVRVAEIRRGEAEGTVTRLVVEALQDTGLSVEKLNLAVRALKRWTTMEEGKQGVAGLAVRSEAVLDADEQIALAVLLDETGRQLSGEARKWLRGHWEQLKELERTRVKVAKAERAAARRADGGQGEGL